MNEVAQSKEYGLVCASFWGQIKWIVCRAKAVVHDGRIDYINDPGEMSVR